MSYLTCSVNYLIFFFEANKGDFITVDRYGAKWTTQEKDSSDTFKKVTLEQSVKFQLSNCFFKLGNKNF